MTIEKSSTPTSFHGWAAVVGCLLLAAACNEPASQRREAPEDSGRPSEAGRDLNAGDRGQGSEATARDVGSDLEDPFGGGQVLFAESFEDDAFASRGWYDSSGGTLTSDDPAEGQRAFACRYLQGGTGCAEGSLGRHLFEPSESLYVSYYVKYSDNFVGSQRAYHPHEFNILTTADDEYTGPAITHLTGYIEQVGGVPRLALQDSLNVDLGCLRSNSGDPIGCNGGTLESYPFSEARSVCACNGLQGDLDGSDCFRWDANTYYSARFWDADGVYFRDEAGPFYKGDWHQVEVYLQMNTLVDGKGAVDGVIRYWLDGQLLISSDRILMRTGAHPDLKFNQFMLGMYIGDGSPVDQTMWVDQLVVATGRPALHRVTDGTR